MRRFVIAALLVVLGRGAAEACEPRSYQPDELLTNEPVFSNDRHYLAIERWYEGVKDFESARADAIMNFDPPADDAPPREPRKKITIAVYEAATRTRLSEVSIPAGDDGELLVSDSGYVAIVRQLYAGCFRSAIEPTQAFVTIIRPGDSAVARLTTSDVLTKSDIESNGQLFGPSVSARIDSRERDLLVLTIDEHERHIDLLSAKLLDPKENLFPTAGAFVDSAPRERPYPSGPFGDAAAVHLTSRDMLDRALDEPLPDYPPVARKARVKGPVWLEVVVSEYGEVIAVRATSLPFGLSDAALATVRKWRFRPLQVNGKRVKYSGEVAMHFEWKLIP